MLPWKRSELWCGVSMQEFNRILDILSANHVRYEWRPAGETFSARNMSPRTEVMGRWGTDPEVSAEYKIYVEKEQLEYARHLISGQN